jgi:hypothetical protein
MTRATRLAALAVIAIAALIAGCSTPTESKPGGARTLVIADSVFATSADGDVANETILLTGAVDPAMGEAALHSAGERFMLVDETGVEHPTPEAAEAALAQGLYTPNYVADPLRTDLGIELYVDTKGWIPDPMRDTFRRILVEELIAAGVTDATVVAARD